MPLLAEVGDGAHDVGLRVPLGQPVEQAEALGGDQLDELGAIHPATPSTAAGARWHSRCTSAKSRLDSALALSQ